MTTPTASGDDTPEDALSRFAREHPTVLRDCILPKLIEPDGTCPCGREGTVPNAHVIIMSLRWTCRALLAAVPTYDEFVEALDKSAPPSRGIPRKKLREARLMYGLDGGKRCKPTNAKLRDITCLPNFDADQHGNARRWNLKMVQEKWCSVDCECDGGEDCYHCEEEAKRDHEQEPCDVETCIYCVGFCKKCFRALCPECLKFGPNRLPTQCSTCNFVFCRPCMDDRMMNYGSDSHPAPRHHFFCEADHCKLVCADVALDRRSADWKVCTMCKKKAWHVDCLEPVDEWENEDEGPSPVAYRRKRLDDFEKEHLERYGDYDGFRDELYGCSPGCPDRALACQSCYDAIEIWMAEWSASKELGCLHRIKFERRPELGHICRNCRCFACPRCELAYGSTPGSGGDKRPRTRADVLIFNCPRCFNLIY